MTCSAFLAWNTGSLNSGLNFNFYHTIVTLGADSRTTSRAMPVPRRTQGHAGKRSQANELTIIPKSQMSTSSALSRPVAFNGGQGFYQADSPRSPSPPASTYFPHVSLDLDREPRPTPDADQHFAYSTTLRRHHHERSFSGRMSVDGLKDTLATEGVTGLWSRVVGHVTGQARNDFSSMENGYAPVQTHPDATEREPKSKDTPSSRFAHLSAEDTLSHFHTSAATGLPSSYISSLQHTHGYNEFSVSSPEPVLLKFAKTIYESPLILLLCGSAIISAIMGNIDDAVSITVAVLIVLTVGFVQEQRSEKSLEALNKLVPHHCHVLRDSKVLRILANDLVPGDIITLTTGDRVPADVRLVDAVDLEIDESSLTGETEARRKTSDICPLGAGREPVALADRICVGYMGTLVRNGEFSLSCIISFMPLMGLGRTWHWCCDCHRRTDRIRCYLHHDARCKLSAP